MFKINSSKVSGVSFICLIFISVAASAQEAPSRKGHGAGNGGHSLGSGFVDVASRVAQAMSLICVQASAKPGCNVLTDYTAAISSTSVVVEPHVYGADGIEKEATNNGKNLITVGEAKWKQLLSENDSAERILRTVIHEFMSVAGKESSNQYNQSVKWIGLLQTNYFSLKSLAAGVEIDETIKIFSSYDVRLTGTSGGMYRITATDASALGFCRLKGYDRLISYESKLVEDQGSNELDTGGRSMKWNYPPNATLSSVTCSN